MTEQMDDDVNVRFCDLSGCRELMEESDMWQREDEWFCSPEHRDERINEVLESLPDEEDITTGDHRTFYQSGKLWLEVGEDEDMTGAIRAKMDEEQFWPNVWFISDHGNAHLMSLADEVREEQESNYNRMVGESLRHVQR